MLDTVAAFLSITAVLAFLNRRYVGVPPAIGVVNIALALSLVNMALSGLAFEALHTFETSLVESIDFSELL